MIHLAKPSEARHMVRNLSWPNKARCRLILGSSKDAEKWAAIGLTIAHRGTRRLT